MANGSYLYLMEYTSKTYNNVQEKSNKTSDRDVSTEEEYDDEDEQGNWNNTIKLSVNTFSQSFYHHRAEVKPLIAEEANLRRLFKFEKVSEIWL